MSSFWQPISTVPKDGKTEVLIRSSGGNVFSTKVKPGSAIESFSSHWAQIPPIEEDEAPVPAEVWRPFASVPRDGTMVLARNRNGGVFCYTAARELNPQEMETWKHWTPMPRLPKRFGVMWGGGPYAVVAIAGALAIFDDRADAEAQLALFEKCGIDGLEVRELEE